jgi:hypothetical protein
MMNSFVRWIILLLFQIAAVPSFAQQLYSCDVSFVRQIDSNGELAITGWAETVLNANLSFTFDSGTGQYAESGGTKWGFDVIQKGNKDNSLKAVRIFRGPASTVVDTLMVMTWDKQQFLYVSGGEVRSGKCTITLR